MSQSSIAGRSSSLGKKIISDGASDGRGSVDARHDHAGQREYGRYGYPRITALLQARGWQVGQGRVQRIWRREGLKVPAKQHPRARLWLNDGSCVRLRPESAATASSFSQPTLPPRSARSSFAVAACSSRFARQKPQRSVAEPDFGVSTQPGSVRTRHHCSSGYALLRKARQYIRIRTPPVIRHANRCRIEERACSRLH